MVEVTHLLKIREQVFFEDVEVGMEIPPLAKEPFKATRVEMYAGVFGAFCPMHVDYNSAKLWGDYPAAFSYGTQVCTYLAQLMTDWIGAEGTLKKLSFQNRAMTWVRDGVVEQGDQLTMKGRVVNKYVKDNENYVECQIWAERQDGETVAPGSATVTLPSRSAAA